MNTFSIQPGVRTEPDKPGDLFLSPHSGKPFILATLRTDIDTHRLVSLNDGRLWSDKSTFGNAGRNAFQKLTPGTKVELHVEHR